MSLLQVQNLSVELRNKRQPIRLLSSVSLAVAAGESCALVGESGAGKSMLARSVLGLLPKTARVTQGQIQFQQKNLLSESARARRRVIGRHISLIPQDPMVSLNPTRRIEQQMIDVLCMHLGLRKREAQERALALLEEVLIKEPGRVLKAYAHELSGGMRQRVLIAMAFSVEPKLIIADEPTTALDVTVQKRVLSLLRQLQRKHKTAILFVTHDLGVVAKLCERVVVMYGGRILEDSPATQLFSAPTHVYTRALLEATPRYDQPEKAIKPVPTELLRALDNA